MSRTKDGFLRYLRHNAKRRPANVAGMRLGHNHVLHDARTLVGFNGFRAFFFDRDDPEMTHFVPCQCGWRDDLGEHFASKDHAKSYDSPRKRANRYREFAANAPKWIGENEAVIT